jgi:hypothetical protein
MKIVLRLSLFFGFVVLGSQQTGYCNNNAIVSLLPARPLTIVRGTSGEILATFKIKDGYHIQANPVKNEFLIAALLMMNTGLDVVQEGPIYPAGDPYILEGSQEILLTYEKEVVIRLPVAVKKSAKSGTENLTGEFYFQPCTSRRCLSPHSIPVSIPVKISVPGNSRDHNLK